MPVSNFDGRAVFEGIKICRATTGGRRAPNINMEKIAYFKHPTMFHNFPGALVSIGDVVWSDFVVSSAALFPGRRPVPEWWTQRRGI